VGVSANGNIKDFNVERAERAAAERRFYLGPYTFKRRPTIPPEVLSSYAAAGRDGDDADTIRRFEQALLDLVEKSCVHTSSGVEMLTVDAWQAMRTDGDEYDVVGFEDMANITTWLVEGISARPTGEPSDSPDGSPDPETGTSSTESSPSEAPISLVSMRVVPSTPSTPA
jgi:hypothetical protein